MIRVALLGSKEEAQSVIRALGERIEVVDTGRGVGIVRDGKMVLGLTVFETTEQVSNHRYDWLKSAENACDQIRKHVVESYTVLSGLLHPSPPPGTENQVKGMISEHARKADWVHLVYELESGASNTILILEYQFTLIGRF